MSKTDISLKGINRKTVILFRTGHEEKKKCLTPKHKTTQKKHKKKHKKERILATENTENTD
ncbi:MAG: hypothetical protein WC155_03485 [Candidatus Cloacimonadales bacterium]